MCGRYTLTQVGPRLVDERFQLGEVALEPATLGRFNVCPTEDILVVTHKGPRAVRWGLVPSYSKKIFSSWLPTVMRQPLPNLRNGATRRIAGDR